MRELATINQRQADAAAEIVGKEALGDTPTSAALRQQGRQWARHVLEGPLSWILSLAYIAVTVFLGATPINAAVSAAIGRSLPHPFASADDGAGGHDGSPPAWLWIVRHLVAAADVTIYAFLGWWTVVLIRLVQRRPWLHRVAGRSVLIGDVPWVAQSAEAFASKLFALSYSIATCSFASANPADRALPIETGVEHAP